MLNTGDRVVVEGIFGQGIITARSGRRLVVNIHGQEIERDQKVVHPL